VNTHENKLKNNFEVLKQNLSPREAADYLNIGFSTVAKMRLKGGGPLFCKIGAKILYRKSDLDEWLASKLRTNTSQVAK
jgi:excisionase family DNA binding protein